MKFAYVAALLIAVSPAAFAQGVSGQAPGHQKRKRYEQHAGGVV